MECMRLCEMKEKEVVNACNCCRIGCVMDVDINSCTGCIEAIIVPKQSRVCGFLGADSEYIIPFSCIKCIGPDVILVEIVEEKFLHKCKV